MSLSFSLSLLSVSHFLRSDPVMPKPSPASTNFLLELIPSSLLSLPFSYSSFLPLLPPPQSSSPPDDHNNYAPPSSSSVPDIAIARCRHVCLICHGRPRTNDLIAEQGGRDRGLNGLGRVSGTQSSPLPLHLSTILQFIIRKTPIEHEELSPKIILPVLVLCGC